jgi:hypothetical protein
MVPARLPRRVQGKQPGGDPRPAPRRYRSI